MLKLKNCSLLRRLPIVASVAVALIQLHSQDTPTSPPQHTFFRVQAPDTNTAPISGRLLIFLKAGSGDSEVSNSEMHLTDAWVCAREVQNLAPGASVEVDADETAFPKPFSTLPSGIYEAQAVLDVDHNYNYKGRGPDDWVSPVVMLAGWKPGVGAEPVLSLDRRVIEDPQRANAFAKLKQAATADVAQYDEMESPLLTRFWGRPARIRAWVILPPTYATHANETYPTVYWTHGFGGDIDGALVSGLRIYERMKAGKMPPMIWVMLNESIPQGTHEFADSVNDGPWGTALTTEFIPHLEQKFRMDAKPTGRLLNGHSSGGWATLQLQINYPKVFGGTWSTSPDPSDFHDFTNVDLYAANANLYRNSDGSPVPIMRDNGRVVATMEQIARLEQVLGPYGGQLESFDWVFSPKGPSGAPQPMFDRATGQVHPEVVAYWHDHYDLAHIVESAWAQRGDDLKGRIHLIVGTADTFYLDGSARKFEAVLTRVDAQPHFTYLPDRTHFNLYEVGKDKQLDKMGLFDQISAEMWDVARPGAKWKEEPPTKKPKRPQKPKDSGAP
jgi:enterochelin esterase-like enzyme